MSYLKCTYGLRYNSFVFFNGVFTGDGYAYKDDAISKTALRARVEKGNGKFCSLDPAQWKDRCKCTDVCSVKYENPAKFVNYTIAKFPVSIIGWEGSVMREVSEATFNEQKVCYNKFTYLNYRFSDIQEYVECAYNRPEDPGDVFLFNSKGSLCVESPYHNFKSRFGCAGAKVKKMAEDPGKFKSLLGAGAFCDSDVGAKCTAHADCVDTAYCASGTCASLDKCTGADCPTADGHCRASCGAGFLCEFCSTVDSCLQDGCQWSAEKGACTSQGEPAGSSLAPLFPGLDKEVLNAPEIQAHVMAQLQLCKDQPERITCQRNYLCQWTRICPGGSAMKDGACASCPDGYFCSAIKRQDTPQQCGLAACVRNTGGTSVSWNTSSLKAHAGLQQCVSPYTTMPGVAGVGKAEVDCACKAGYWKSPGGKCLVCDEGTFKAMDGDVPCLRCPTGQYTESLGATSCATCPAGTTTVFDGAHGKDECVCDVGFVLADGVCGACGPLTTTGAPGVDTCSMTSVAGALIGVLVVLLLGGPATYLLVQRRIRAIQAAQWEEEKKLFREVCNSATEMQFPMVLMSGQSFLNEGGLMSHEKFRKKSTESGGSDMIYIDHLADLMTFLETFFVVFFSHQWVAWSHPDPENVQYKCMTASLHRLLGQYKRELNQTYVWVDYTGITQQNALTLGLCINTLPLYSRHSSAFVAVTPPTEHKDTCRTMDYASYQNRAWCRLEQLTHHILRGPVDMFITDAENELRSYAENEQAEEDMFYLFEGDLTCCAMKHRLAGKHIPCDRTKFVYPMLALYASVYVLRHEHSHLKNFYNRIHKDVNRAFPPTYQHLQPNGSAKKTLFGDKVAKLEKFLDALANDDPLQTTLRASKENKQLKRLSVT